MRKHFLILMLLTLLPLATWAGYDVTVKPIDASMTYGTVPDVTTSMFKIQSIGGSTTVSNEDIKAAAIAKLTVSGVTATTNVGTASYGLAVTGGEGAKVTVSGEDFYIYVEGTATMTIEFATSVTLSKGSLDVVSDPLTYYETNGAAVPQTLFTGLPTATCGAADLTSEVEYSVDGGASWHHSIADAKGSDADKYTLRVRLQANDNHAAGTTLIFDKEKQILKADATLNANNITGFGGPFTYGSTSITPGYADDNVSYGNEVTYEYKKGTGTYGAAPDWSTAGAGQWTVKASFAGNSNWNAAADVEKTFTINKADMTGDLTLPDVIPNLKYTGAKQQIFSAGGTLGSLGTVHFNVDDQGWKSVVTDDDAKALTAGTHEIEYYVRANDQDNYNDIGDVWGHPAGTFSVSIEKGDPTVTGGTFATSLTYNGDNQTLMTAAPTEKLLNGTVQYYVDDDATAYDSWNAIVAKNAGAHTIYYSVTGNASNINQVEKEVLTNNVNIAQKSLTVSAQKVEVDWTGDPIDYTQQQMVLAKTSEWAAADNDEAARKAILAQMLTVTIPDNATDAGEYEFSVAETTGQKTNYKPEILAPNNKLIINQIASTMTTAPVAATGLVYDGNAKTLVDASGAVFNGGKLVYSLTETGDYVENTEDLNVKNAGTHSVWCKVQGDKNHLDTTPVEITGIQISASSAQTFGEWTDGGFTFGETAVLPTVAATYEDAEISYQYKKGADGTYGAAPAKWTAGTWYAKATAAATANYAEAVNAVEKEFVVSAAAQTFGEWTDGGFTFGETAVLPTVAATYEDAAISYTFKKEGEADFAEAPAKFTAGTWFVKAAAAATANYAAAETDGTQTFVVSAADQTFGAWANTQGFVYGSEAVLPTVAATYEDAAISYTFKKEGDADFAEAPAKFTAGTWYVKAAAAATANYAAAETDGTQTFVVSAADQTFGDWANTQGFVYGEAAVLPTVAATYEEAAISYTFKKEGDAEFAEAPAEWTAGTWFVKAAAAATANYAAAETDGTQTFVVSAAAQTFGAWANTQGFVYGSEAVLPEITANENPVITYTYKKEGEAEFAEAPAEWTAGTWFVKAAAAATANYAAAETDGTQTFVVSQKPVTPVAPAAIALTYNGLAQELVTAGSAEGATIQYALGEGEFGDAIPTAKDAGTYTVKYKFTVDDNYSFTPTEGEVNVKINKAHLAYSLGNQTATYTGKAIAPVLGQAYDLADGDLMVGDDEAFTLSFPATEGKNFTDVNTYNFSKLNVTWNEGFKENYTIQFYNNGSLTIEKAAITDADFNDPKAVGGVITYDGNAQTLFNAGSWKDDKNFGIFMYSEDNENWSTEIADKTDAGTYNLYWKIVADDNHLDFNSADYLTKTIVEKTWNAQVPAFFDGDLVKVYAKGHNYLSDLEGALDLFDGTTALTADDYDLVITNTQKDPETEQPVVATKAEDVDVYTFTYTGKGNYAGSETAWTLTINKAELVDNFALSATEAEYSSEDQLPTLKAAAGLEKDVDFIVDAPAKAINVGEYNFVITPGKNYYLTGEAANYTKTFEITPATVLVSAGNCEKVYNGEAGLAGATKPELLFAGIKKNDKAEEVITKKDAEAYGVTVAEASKNFGTYALNIDLDAFAVANNNYVLAANGVQGTLTISKKDLAIAFKDHDAEGNYLIQKNYGEADDFEEVADLVTLEGAVAADAADIIAGITVTRSNATENSVGKYEDVLEIATEGDVFANYNVDATAKGDFEIVAGTLTIALKKAAGKVYDGVAPDETLEIKATDLAVTGMDEGDKIEDIFTTLPTVTVQNGAKDAATYVVKLSGGVAPNYNLEEATYLDGQYIITPKELTATIGTQIVSVEATELPNANGFSIEGAVEGDDLKAALSIKASTEAAGTFDDGILLTINNANYTLKNNTGKLIVVDAAENGLVFDTNTVDIVETLQASNGAKCDITIKGRSTNNNGIEAKKWIGMVLPFDVTVEELVEVFGYSIINTYDAANSTAAHMKFQVEQDGIPANTPFIIKPKKNISAAEGFTFEGVTIKAPATASVSVEVGGNSFVGQYEAYTIEKKETPNSTYLRDGGWKRAKNSDRVIVPFDCYITWPEGAEAPSISIEDEGGVTKIATITTDGRIIEAEGWYTVNGMKLDAAPTEKGVYVKDGKKVVIK